MTARPSRGRRRRDRRRSPERRVVVMPQTRRGVPTHEPVEVAQLEQPADREQSSTSIGRAVAEPGVVGRQELAVRVRPSGPSVAPSRIIPSDSLDTRRRSARRTSRSSRLARIRMRSAGTVSPQTAQSTPFSNGACARADPSADSLLPARRARRRRPAPRDTPGGIMRGRADPGDHDVTTGAARGTGRGSSDTDAATGPLPPLVLEGQGRARSGGCPGWKARSAASPG